MIVQHKNMLLVGCRLEDKDFYISGTRYLCCKIENGYRDIVHPEPLSEGNWQLQGTITQSEISFDVEPFVEKVDYIINNQSQGILYRDYYYPDKDEFVSEWYSKPEPSFRSLMQSIGAYLVNPYKGEGLGFELTPREWDLYHQAQQTTSPKWALLTK